MGKPWERVFWGIVLLAVLGFLAFKINGFYTMYRGFEHRTEIRVTDTLNLDAAYVNWPEIRVFSDQIFEEVILYFY